MATIKKLYFANGTDVTTPADLSFESSTNHLETYADDAAYVTANGAATEGDIYLNTTLEAPRAYLGGAWRTALMANNAADATKLAAIDLTGAASAKTQTLVFVGTDNRSYTFPDYNGRLAINTGTETNPILFSGATGNLDIGNASGTVRIVGNLEVQGNTTTLNTQTVQVEDNNILVNYGGSDITAQGSGLQVQTSGTAGSLIYDSAAATKFKAGLLGAEVEIVDKSTAQALTNKTIDGSLNTISNLTSAMVTGTIAPSKGGTGVSNNDAATLTRTGNFDLNVTTSAATAITLPTSGTMATLAGTEVLTNKDIDGGTASNTSRLTIPKATKTTLDALTRKEATMVYGTDTKKLYVDYDSTLNEIGGGAGGAAGRNYLSAWYTSLNPVGTVVTGLTSTGNRTSSQTSWGASATADLTIANNATLPLRETGDFLIDSSTTTAGAFVESPMFNLDLVDLSKAVVLSFDITGNAADGNYDVVVIRYNSSGTYQETISAAGNASAGSPASAKLPTGTTTFKGFFVSSNTQTDFYSVRIRKILAVNDDFQIDSLFVGPQSLSAGVAITESNLFAPIFTNSTGLTFTGSCQYQRVANSLVLNLSVSITGTGSVASPLRLNLPLAGITAVAGDYAGGNGGIKNADINNRALCVRGISGQNYIEFSQASSPSSSLNGTAFNDTASSNAFYFLDISASIPISQWSSNVTMADRAVEEYASNSSTSDANDTTSFAYGVNGSSLPGSLTALRTKRVQFTTPILPTDALILEVSFDRVKWSEVLADDNGNALDFQAQNLSTYGMTLRQTSGLASNQINVQFGTYAVATNTTYGAAGAGWNLLTQGYYRVRKVSGGAAVGYPVSARNIVGDTSGTAVPSGYVSERLFSSRLRSASLGQSSGVAADITSSITLGLGTWTISGSYGIRTTGANLVNTGMFASISAVSNALASSADTISVPNSVGEFSVYVQKSDTYSNGNDVVLAIPAYTVTLSASSTLRLVGRVDFSSGTPNGYGFIQAIRIA